MKDKERNLGRNFADLMQENSMEVIEKEEVLELEIDAIIPNADQPRSVFDMEALSDLANSIKEHGVVQPVIVRPSGSRYMLVAGERRLKASRLAGLLTVPAIVRNYNADYVSEIALIENLQREDLTPIEEAIAFQTVLTKYNMTHEDLGRKIGKSRVYVTNMIGLLRLPKTVIESVNHGVISMGHARALSKLTDQAKILTLHEQIIKDDLTVRELESRIRNLKQTQKSNVSQKTVQQMEKRIGEYLPKNLRYKLSKTQLSIKFDSEEEIQQIIDLLKGGSSK